MPHRPIVILDTDRLPSGPWIYARQLRRPEQDIPPGEIVEVVDWENRFIGHGLFNDASDIRVRMIARGKRSDLDRPKDFLLRKIAAADRLRRKILRLEDQTDAWRLAHAEGDDLPGLIIDKLGPALVCEYHSRGFWKLRREVEWALGELHPGLPIVHRVPKAARRSEGFEPEEEPESIGEVILNECGLRYSIEPGIGHKTGWFCDQRENRQRVASFAKDRDVLDLCCNTGGFALAAARAGARGVTAIDLDEVVLEKAVAAAQLNGLDIEFRHEDAFHTLRSALGYRRRPQLVILDPSKFVRGRADFEAGRLRYLDLNALAIQATAAGGILATFSCSGAVDLSAFMGILFQAARRAGRSIKLLEVLGAGPDHPQRPEFSRSRYLKGALLAVD
ncbi:MAG: 23S rRNA (cytosine1962-C5)-methyltransferase [Planctomycetota bacterium]|jgi:23S rRNA (cytosine1962-C5)-methyltransferase